MATGYLNVPAGTVSSTFFVTPLTSVCAGPAVLGGTTLLEFSKDGVNSPWVPWSYGTSSSVGSFRPDTNGYCRVTAATQATTVLSSVLGQDANPFSVTVPLASPSTTSEVIIWTGRIPAGFLRPSFQLLFSISLSFSNNANAKSAKLYWGGTGGTAMFTTPALASQLNYNFQAVIAGRGSAISVIGSAAGSTGGLGLTTTALPTAVTPNILTAEVELALTCTKATAGDTFQIEMLNTDLTF